MAKVKDAETILVGSVVVVEALRDFETKKPDGTAKVTVVTRDAGFAVVKLKAGGLRRFAGLGLERDDETIAAEEVGTDDDTVCFLTAEGWRTIREHPTLQAELLNILEAGGWAGLRATLDAHGIAYDEVAAS